jgi:hypothetical protein
MFMSQILPPVNAAGVQKFCTFQCFSDLRKP